MTVYVDDAMLKYGRMKMCHLIADTDEELHEIARLIGVARKWHQAPPEHDSHYDICASMRKKAVELGVVEISYRECGCMNARRRVTGELGEPIEAISWFKNNML